MYWIISLSFHALSLPVFSPSLSVTWTLDRSSTALVWLVTTTTKIYLKKRVQPCSSESQSVINISLGSGNHGREREEIEQHE